MSHVLTMSWILALTIVSFAATASASEAPAPTPDEQVAALESMCSASAEARSARHAETSLYERLGGDEKIHALTTEIIRLHHLNAPIVRTLKGVDSDALARGVAEFIISGTGGPAVYHGPSMPDAHAHLKLTNADFLSAGSDVMLAMKNLGYGQEEIDEMVCILVGLRAQVVVEEDRELKASR